MLKQYKLIDSSEYNKYYNLNRIRDYYQTINLMSILEKKGILVSYNGDYNLRMGINNEYNSILSCIVDDYLIITTFENYYICDQIEGFFELINDLK